MVRMRNLYMVLMAVFVFLVSPAAMAEERVTTGQNDEHQRVVMVVINGLSMEDLQHLAKDHSPQWLHEGSIAGMNLRTAGSMNAVNNYVTIGAGSRGVGSENALSAYNGWETINGNMVAGDLFQQYTGRTISPGQVFVPGVQYILKNIKLQSHMIIPGALGEHLQEYGLKVAVLGNADRGEEQPYRLAPLISMNNEGVTPLGDVSRQTWREAGDRPYGMMTDYQWLHEKMMDYKKQASLIVVELGDLDRLDSMMEMIQPAHYEKLRSKILAENSRFIDQLVAEQSAGELLLVVSPMVGKLAAEEKSMLAPVVMIEQGMNQDQFEQGGVLRSSTTQRDGVIANIDIAPTIFNWLGIPAPAYMMGAAMENAEGKSFWQEWERTVHVYKNRPAVLFYYVTAQVILLIIATFLWLKVGRSRLHAWARLFLLTLIISPTLFLLESWIPFLLSAKATLAAIGGSALLAALLMRRLSVPSLFFIAALTSWLPLAVDNLTGSLLMKHSYLGYDPVVGARFYGMGNEYMGVLIGSSILFVAACMEMGYRRGMKAFSLLLFVGLFVILAAPWWGTNAGGVITALVGFSIAYVKIFQLSLTKKRIGILLLVILLGFAGLVAINIGQPEAQQSHIGKALSLFTDGNGQEIFNIIQRKLAMNWSLIQVSSWSKVFLTSILVLAIFLLNPRLAAKIFRKEYPFISAGMGAITAAALTALLVNDSGIVAAATTIIYVVVPLLYLALQKKEAGFLPGLLPEVEGTAGEKVSDLG